ncbi:MAG: hypothetical protein RLZZ488_2668 [Pseudomonadota bacterium]|jgi:hypothetical protein
MFASEFTWIGDHPLKFSTLFCALLLTAPMHKALAVDVEHLMKSGGEAFDSIKSKGQQMYESGKSTTGELLDKGKETTGELYEKGKETTGELYEKGKETTGEIIDKGKKTAVDTYDKTVEMVKKERTSRDNRKDSFLTLNLSPFVYFSLPLPKSGFQIGWVINEGWTVDPEYLSGSFGFDVAKISIGEISETLISLPLRYFPGNNFNWKFGGTYRKLTAVLGNTILEKIVNRPTTLDLLEYKFYSINLGLGNRWQLNNGITLGADWLDFNIPVSVERNEIITSYITDENDRKNVRRGIDILTALQFTALKLQIGYTF